jgi:CcmD family protein
VSSSFQTNAPLPSSRSTGFIPANEAISPEVRAFGAAFIVFWLLLLAFLFVTRRKQRALRAEVDRLEAALGTEQ